MTNYINLLIKNNFIQPIKLSLMPKSLICYIYYTEKILSNALFKFINSVLVIFFIFLYIEDFMNYNCSHINSQLVFSSFYRFFIKFFSIFTNLKQLLYNQLFYKFAKAIKKTDYFIQFY